VKKPERRDSNNEMTMLSKMAYLFTYFLLIATCFISDVYGRGDGALKKVPYAAIIEDARIETNSLKSPTMDALIQGNGDIHSLVYAQENQIILRLAKNDVYDARIETADDLELANIDIATGKTSRILSLPPSWDKPYPLSINFVNLLIDYSGSSMLLSIFYVPMQISIMVKLLFVRFYKTVFIIFKRSKKLS